MTDRRHDTVHRAVHCAARRTARRPAARRGFTFIELLFAMAVLSIGMLGVAAAVYVGVDQTKSTLDDSTAAAIARQAAAQLGQLMTDANTPASTYVPLSEAGPPETKDPPVVPTPPNLKDVVRSAPLAVADRRFAWSALYRRGAGGTPGVNAPTADLIVAVLRAGNSSEFGPDNVAVPADTAYKPDLTPVLVSLSAHANAGTGEITLEIDAGLTPNGKQALAPGAFIVITGGTSDPSKHLDGTVVQLGGRATDVGPDEWTMSPGYALPAAAVGEALGGLAFGRGYTDPTRPELGYSGPNRAVAVYQTTVLLH